MPWTFVTYLLAMDYDTTQQSVILRKILRHLGLWHDDKIKHRLPNIVISLIIHIPLTFTFTVLMWVDIIKSADFNEAMDVLHIVFTETGLIVKILSILTHMRMAVSMFHEWQTHEHFQLHTLQELYMWQSSFKRFGRVVFIYITISFSVVLAAFSSFIYLDTYQLPFRYWTPFDCGNKTYFWYAYVYEFVAMPLTCVSNCTLDMLQCFIMQYPAMCFATIAMRLENLGSQKSQKDKDIRKNLLQIIQFDQKVRSMCQQCERLVSYPILAQILLSALVLCFSLYHLKNVSFFDNPGDFISLWQYATCMTLQIFFPCYYGNQLTVNSSRPLSSVFHSNWAEMSSSNRRMILTYMHYLNKPVVLRAGNFFEVGLPTFSKTMNNAYSFFALLLNLDME